MDFPTKGQLLTNLFNKGKGADEEVESIRNYIGVESLKYLSLQGLLNSVPKFENETCSYCTACFTGDYPIQRADADEAECEEKE